MKRRGWPGRSSRRAATAHAALRDEILAQLLGRSALIEVLQTAHPVAAWADWSRMTSLAEIADGLELLDEEERRLDAQHQRGRRKQSSECEIDRAVAAAEVERIDHRLTVIGEQRRYLRSRSEQVEVSVEIESAELEHPLLAPSGDVVGYVDLFVTLKIPYVRLVRGSDPLDPESRPRYEACTSQHLEKSFALHVVPVIHSLSGTVKRVRFVQAYARESLPILITTAAFQPEILASQGIPTYVWSATRAHSAERLALPPGGVRSGTEPPSRVRAVPPTVPPRLPSPRPSLPPAPL